MAELFTTILNMSMTASIIILIVLLARLCLKKAPKIYSYLLWTVVLFRLLCPVSFSLPVSVLAPMSEASTTAGTSYTASMEYISVPQRPEPQHTQPPITSEPPVQDENNNVPVIPEQNVPAVVVEQQSKRSTGEIFLTIFGWVWAIGMVGVLGFTTWQTLMLKRKLDTAFIIRGNIFESEKIDTAFILGVFNPKIYLPLDLPFDIQKAVVAHEQTHQRRGDHIVKLVSYLVLAVHWFNPLVWLSFKLMCDDMEKSCDEAVLCEMNNRGYSMKSIKKAYGNMLLVLGGGKQHIFSPVSFAENNTKSRVNNLVAYSRVAKTTSIILVAVCVLVVGLCMFNPVGASAQTIPVTSEADVVTNEGDEPQHDSDAKMIETECGVLWTGSTEVSLWDISDLSFLKDFKNLTSLELHNVIADDWSVLEGCENLTELYISGFSNTDISMLEFCPNIKWFSLGDSHVTDLSPLNHCRQLEEVQLWYSDELENYSVISNLPHLKNLEIFKCKTFTSAEAAEIKNLGQIECLNISVMDDISFLSDLTNLTGLSVQVRNQKEVDIVGSLANLKDLKITVYYAYGFDANHDSPSEEMIINDLRAIDLSPLKNLKNLESIDAEGYDEAVGIFAFVDGEYARTLTTTNLLNSLPTDNLRKIRLFELFCMTTETAPLLSHFKNLEEVNVNFYSDNMNTESLAKMPNLRVIKIENYSESALDVSQIGRLTSLEHLEVSGNIRGEASLSGLTNLKFLKIPTSGYGVDGENDLSFCSEMKNLTSLEIYISENGVDLSCLSGLTELRELIVHGRIPDISFMADMKMLERIILWSEGYSAHDEITEYLSQTYGEEYHAMDLSQSITESDYASLVDVIGLDLSALAEMSNLRELYITDYLVDLSLLDSCKKLERIELDCDILRDAGNIGNRMHLAQLDEFRSKHPSCYVYCDE